MFNPFKWLTKRGQQAAQRQQVRRAQPARSKPASTGHKNNSSTTRSQRSNAQSNYSQPSYSNNRSGGNNYRKNTSGSQRRTGATQKRPQNQKKKQQDSWQSYIENRLKSTKSKAQSEAKKAYQKKVAAEAKAKEEKARREAEKKKQQQKKQSELKAAAAKAKATNALGTKARTRTSGSLKSKDLTSEEYLRLQNASRIGGKVGTKSLGKDLAEKVGSRTAYSANRNRISRITTGAMQGLAYGDVLEGGVGTYNKAARKELQKAKESTSFNIGYGAGQMAGFALGGTSGMAKALVSGGGKAAAKAGAKAGAKGAAKAAAKSSKSVGKKFAKNRAAEMAVEAPMNLVDAAKMSRDENGKIDKKKLAGYMALNTGLTGGAGAAMEGAAIKFTKKNGKDLIALQAKANKGKLSEKEGKTLKKLYAKLDDARKDTASAKSGIAEADYAKGREMVQEARIQKGRQKGAARLEEARQAKTSANNAKVERAVNQSVESTQAKKNNIINEKVGRYTDEVSARNEKAARDKSLEYNLAGREETQIVNPKTPDVSKPPKGMTPNENKARSARSEVRKRLGGDHTPEQKAQIHAATDEISNMIAHGDIADARSSAYNLAKKHGKVAREETNYDPGRYQRLRELLADAKATIKGANIKLDTISAKELRENTGRWSSHVKISDKSNGKNVGIDEVYDEWSKANPEMFPPVESETERIEAVLNVSRMTDNDLRRMASTPYHLTDEEIEEAYRSMADDIVESASKNADAMKSKSAPKSEKGKESATENVDETPRETSDRSGGPESIDSIMGRVKDNIGSEAGETPAMRKAFEDAQETMQKAKNAKANKDVEDYVNRLTNEREEPGKFQDDIPEKAQAKDEIPERAQARGDLPDARSMSESELKEEVRKLKGGTNRKGYLKNTEEKYGADSPRAKEMREHLQDVEERLEDIKHEKKTGQKTRRTDEAPVKQRGAGFTLDEPRTRIGKALKALYRVAVDSEVDIERLARKIGGETGQDLLAAGNAFRNARNIAGSFVKTGRFTFERQPSGKSLDAIFKPLKGDKALREDAINYSYLVHNLDRTIPQEEVDELIELQRMVRDGEELTDEATERLAELKAKDKPIAGMPRSKEATQQAIDELKDRIAPSTFKKIEEFQEDIVKYADDMLQYKVDAGVVSEAEAKKLRDTYKNYIPSFTNKEFSGAVDEIKNTDVTIDRGLKAAHGAGLDDELVDLYSQMVQVTRSTVKHCEMNELIRTLGDAQGVKYADIDKSLSPDEILENSIFINKQAGSGKKAFFFKDGKRYEVPLTEDMYMGLREMTGEEKAILLNNPVNRLMMRPMRIFKGLITDWNVLFGVRNGVRDLATALTYTKDVKGFIKAYPKAIRAIAKKDDYYKAYIAAGGEFSTLAKQNGFDQALKALEDGKMSPLRWANEINGVIEMMPRMQEFISTIDKAGVSPNMAGRKVIDKAMRNANDVTLNFGRSGIVGKAFNTGAVPYLNPSIQGLDKLIRVFVEAKNEKNMRGIISLGMKMSTFAIAPSVFNEYMLRNDEDYQQLNTRDKDNNYFIPLGPVKGLLGADGSPDDKGKFIKIPKARELVVAAEPFQYFFRHAQFGDSGGWQQMFKTAIDNVGVINPLTDNFFSPVVRMATNKTWYGGDIETSQDLDLPVQDRYDETTSLIGIKLGQTEIAKSLKLSPKKIDNLIDSYFGMIGDYLLPQFTEASKGNPFINQFITDSVFSNKLATETWENYNDLKEKMNSKDLSEGEKQKLTYKYQDLSNQYIDDACKLSAAISQVQADKSLTKDEKATLVRTLKQYQNEIYRSSKDGSLPTLNGKEVDPLYAIYKTLHNKKGAKAIDIAFSVASEDMQEAYAEYGKFLDHAGVPKERKIRDKKKFLDYSVDLRKTNGYIGETKDKFISWKTAAVVGAINGYSDNMQNAYGVNDETKGYAKTYGKDFAYPLDHYVWTERTNLLASRKIGLEYKSKMQSHDVAMAQASKKNDDGSYYIGDSKPYYQKGRMPAARYLVKTDKKQWTTKEIHDFAAEHDYNYKSDYDEVYAQARKTYKNFSDLECAAVAQVITNKGYNDFGDMTLETDSGIMDTVHGSGWGGRRRGRRRRGWHRRGRRGGGGGGATGTPWEDYIAEKLAPAEKKKEEKKEEPKEKPKEVKATTVRQAPQVQIKKESQPRRTSKAIYRKVVARPTVVNTKVKAKNNTHKSELTEAYMRRQRAAMKKVRPK